MRSWRRFVRDERAATAAEYAVMLGLILMSVIAAIGVVGGQTGGLWGSIDSKIEARTSGS